MVPPKLRLVTNDGIDDADAPEAQEAIELARAIAEVEGGGVPENEPEAEVPPARGEDWLEDVRIVEALLFASSSPLDEEWLAKHLRHGSDIGAVIEEIKALYAPRGVNLVRVAGKWVFRTAEDLGYLLEIANAGGIEVPEEVAAARWLTPWAAQFRYDEPEIAGFDRVESERSAERAVAWALRVLDAAR